MANRRFHVLATFAASLALVSVCITPASGVTSARSSAPSGQTVTGSGWQPPEQFESVFSDVSCASSKFCAAVTWDGGVRMFDGISWSAEQSLDDGVNLHVSCPTTKFCVAVVGSTGDAVVYQNGIWNAPVDVDPDLHLFLNISCSSPRFCVAIDLAGAATYFDGTTWRSGAEVPDTIDVSCTSSTFCIALDEGGLASLYNGSTWTDMVNTRLGNGSAVSCVSSKFCAAAGPRHKLNVYAHDTWADAVKVLPGHKGGLTGLSCGSARFCVAVDWYGRSFIYDGATWSLVWMRAKSFEDDTYVSCSGPHFCAAVSATGWVSLYQGS